MDPSGGGVATSGQNLNDLQNYLVTFNKEIETDQETTMREVIIVQGESQTVTPVECVENLHQDETSAQSQGVSTAAQFTGGFYTEQAIIDQSLEEQAVQQIQGIITVPSNIGGDQTTETTPSVVHDEEKEPDSQNEMLEQRYQAYIAELTDSQALATVETSSASQGLAVSTVVQNSGNQTPGNVIRIVSVGDDGQMQLVSEEMPQGMELALAQEHVASSQSVEMNVEQQQDIIDGTDPVAVLASVAANTTSAANHLQAVTVNQNEVHNAQLVALQNSADSSQPQLVAVQTGEGGSGDTLQVIGTTDTGTSPGNSVILNTGNSFQTVTIVPSEVNQGGEVSYVLIVSQPDGEKDGTGKAIAVDMSVYDFKEEAREVTEEIIEEDGTTKRILKITPKKAFPGSPSQLMCHYCNYTSPKRYLLTRHMKSHSEERPHKCNICDRGFKTIASLTNHVNTHTGIRPHKCKQCEAAFTTSGELVRHVRYRHTFEKPHKCPECDYASVELSKLKRHMRSHTGERPYQCPHCSYASPDTYKLKRHLRIHTGEKPYECDVCHARFTQSNSLKAHKLIHSGDKPIFQCDLCPTTCGRKTDLKIHIQKLHTSERPLVCRKCGKSFPDRYSYKLHIKQHEGEKCFKCENCDYAALSQRHLDSHMLTHSGEKPYECDECDQTFRQKQLLRRHKNLHHTPDYVPPMPKEKTYDCSECDKSFAHKGNLMRHMQQHGVECSFSDEDSLDQNLSDSGNVTSPDRSISAQSTISAHQLLHSNLMQELREGKLGNAPQVVIVHPDGRVEEVTPKLQVPPDRTVDDLLLAMDAVQEGNEQSGTSGMSEVGGEKEDCEPQQSVMGESQSVSLLEQSQMKEAGTQVEIESESEEDDDVENKEVTLCNKETEKVEPAKEKPDNTTKTATVVLYPGDNLESVVDGLPVDMVSEGTEFNVVIAPPSEDIDNVEKHADEGETVTKVVTSPVQVKSDEKQSENTVLPERQTRSMKRKEEEDSCSPAKRTRRSTAESK